MDNRSKFLYWTESFMRDGVTQKDKRTRQMEQPGQAARLEREANPLFFKAEL